MPFLFGLLLFFVFVPKSSAMEVVCNDGYCFLKVTTPEITLIWEHSCMKHLANREWHRARQIKKVIEWQRASRKYLSALPDQLESTRQQLREAEVAKAQAGNAWGCKPPEAKLEMVSMRIGRDPQAQTPVTSSFASNEMNRVSVIASASLLDKQCESPELAWRVFIPKYYAEKEHAGSYDFEHGFTIPEASRGDRGDDFKVELNVNLVCEGDLADNLGVTIGQDDKDQLRQEYIDMKKERVPEREELLACKNTRHFTQDQFNTSQKARGGRYSEILCRILDNLEGVRTAAGEVAMAINSGFRNPYKNGRISGSGRESQHLYGLAADIGLEDFNKDGKTNDDDWHMMAKAAKGSGACVEPDTSTWIHMDWRGTCPPGW